MTIGLWSSTPKSASEVSDDIEMGFSPSSYSTAEYSRSVLLRRLVPWDSVKPFEDTVERMAIESTALYCRSLPQMDHELCTVLGSNTNREAKSIIDWMHSKAA